MAMSTEMLDEAPWPSSHFRKINIFASKKKHAITANKFPR